MGGGGFIVVAALVANSLTCDDTCGSGSGWTDDPDAWQWDAQLVLAIAAACTALAGALLLFTEERRLGARVFFAGVGAGLLWLAVIASAY